MRTPLKEKQVRIHRRKLTRPVEHGDNKFTEAHAWDMVNWMLCSWLLNIIDPKLRLSIAYSEMVKTMWDDLKKWYGMAKTPKIHQLKAGIANCKQGDLSVGDFYLKPINL